MLFFRYKAYFTRSKAIIICFCMWLCLAGVTLIPIFNDGTLYFVHLNYVVYYWGDFEFVMDLFFYLPLFICWGISITTVCFIKRNKLKADQKKKKRGTELRTVAQQRQATLRARQDKVNKKKDLKIAFYY